MVIGHLGFLPGLPWFLAFSPVLMYRINTMLRTSSLVAKDFSESVASLNFVELSQHSEFQCGR